MKEKKSNSKDLAKKDSKKTKSQSTPTNRKIDLGTWKFENPVPAIPKEKKLRIETRVPAIIHWSADEWETVTDTPTRENNRGRHIASVAGKKEHGDKILFTFYWPDTQRWENKDFEVLIIEG